MMSVATQPAAEDLDIFRRVYAEIFPVSPLCIFAAGRKYFTAVVRDASNAVDAKTTLFEVLPLAENGWDQATAKISRVGNSYRGPLWKLERE